MGRQPISKTPASILVEPIGRHRQNQVYLGQSLFVDMNHQILGQRDVEKRLKGGARRGQQALLKLRIAPGTTDDVAQFHLNLSTLCSPPCGDQPVAADHCWLSALRMRSTWNARSPSLNWRSFRNTAW
jgi:hypothetical protein